MFYSPFTRGLDEENGTIMDPREFVIVNLARDNKDGRFGDKKALFWKHDKGKPGHYNGRSNIDVIQVLCYQDPKKPERIGVRANLSMGLGSDYSDLDAFPYCQRGLVHVASVLTNIKQGLSVGENPVRCHVGNETYNLFDLKLSRQEDYLWVLNNTRRITSRLWTPDFKEAVKKTRSLASNKKGKETMRLIVQDWVIVPKEIREIVQQANNEIVEKYNSLARDDGEELVPLIARVIQENKDNSDLRRFLGYL